MIIESYPHGHPCWVDLMTTDQKAAIAFYSALLDWNVLEPQEETNNYGLCFKGDQAVAGIGPIGENDDYPSSWTTYIRVDDADTTVAAATKAGGSVLLPPMDVPGEKQDTGRMAILADPVGGVFGIWQPKEHQGSGLKGEPGSFEWNELLSRDVAAARGFLTEVFGYDWAVLPGGESMDYQIAKVAEAQVLGTMPVPKELPAEVPSHWMTYFAVADTDDTVARASEAGATVAMPAMDSLAGRIAVLVDPTGAAFGVLQHPKT